MMSEEINIGEIIERELLVNAQRMLSASELSDLAERVENLTITLLLAGLVGDKRKEVMDEADSDGDDQKRLASRVVTGVSRSQLEQAVDTAVERIMEEYSGGLGKSGLAVLD